MDHISELRNTLSDFFKWNKARLTCLVNMVESLFCVRTVNLTQIAAAFQTDCKEESAYRRVCRFFTDFSFDLSAIAPFVLKLFCLEQKCTLILDRTNWKWGKTPVNILMLSIAYKDISIPFFWSVLNLEGNSCTDDRVALFRRALNRFPVEKIGAFVADREFIGTEWFSYLISTGIPFVIRVKKSYKITDIEKDNSVILSRFLKSYGRKKKVLNVPIKMWGHKLYLSFRKGTKGTRESMVLVSNYPFEEPFKVYKRRWQIETLFGCLKTRGFRMEDTHVTDPDKIEKMLFVLTIAFCWAYRTGEWTSEVKPIAKKTHGRKAKSLFRLGLDIIRRAILRITSHLTEFLHIASFLNPSKRRSCNA